MRPSPSSAALVAFGQAGAEVTPWHRHGSTSASLVSPSGQPELVLTCGSARGTAAQLHHRAAIVEHLADEGLPVAVPVRAANGDPFVIIDDDVWLLAPRLAPPAGATDAPSLRTWQRVGAQFAVLHRALAGAPDGLTSWRVDLATQTRGVDLPAVRRARAQGRLPADLGAGVDVERLVSQLAGLPEQRLHGDCHGGNLLLCSEGWYGIVDLDHLPIGPRVYDLGYYAADLVKNRRYVPDDVVAAVGAMVAGYHHESPLSPAEAAAVVAYMIATELQFLRLFLDDRPGNDDQLRAHVETMRALDERAGEFEEAVTAAVRPSCEQRLEESRPAAPPTTPLPGW